ncbi:MAG: nucleotidyltransferase family protein [Methanosarcina sp.]
MKTWSYFLTIPKSTDEKRDLVDFTRILRQQLPELSKKYNISYLGIFGSYVRGEQKEDSDLDILVEFSKAPDFFEFIGLKQDLSDILEVNVDLVMKSALKPRIGRGFLKRSCRYDRAYCICHRLTNFMHNFKYHV